MKHIFGLGTLISATIGLVFAGEEWILFARQAVNGPVFREGPLFTFAAISIAEALSYWDE